MADDTASNDAPEAPESPLDSSPVEAQREAEPAASSGRSWFQANRTLVVAGACVGLCGVIAADLAVMMKASGRQPGTASAVGSASALPPSVAPIAPETAGTAAAARASNPAVTSTAGEADDFEDQTDDSEPHAGKAAPPKHYATVQQAAIESCTTASVDGLSRQIIAQAQCIKPNAFVPLPSRPNLVIGKQVFPYLEAEARTRLLKALDSRQGEKMTINSALRTVAQQYLVRHWSATKRCGVPLATPPGASNHEIGIALDIAEHGTWRAALEAQDFKWLGDTDRVHFDYKPKSAFTGSATDVLAFQMLWNRNNPKDPLQRTGRYDSPTEDRLKKSPADGFELGARCEKGRAAKR